MSWRIWHEGMSSVHDDVNGVNYVVWTVGREQAALGCDVHFLLQQAPGHETAAYARRCGIKLHHVAATRWGYDAAALQALLDTHRPQLVHQHSIFLPRQAGLSRVLRRMDIPYVATPHALCPQLLARNKWRKRTYGLLFEKPRMRGAAAVTGVTEPETLEAGRYLAPYSGLLRTVLNPVDLPGQSPPPPWSGPQQGTIRRLVYLGRFDVEHKGLDILFEIARALPPDVEVHLYGKSSGGDEAAFQSLLATAPTQVKVHEPVFGERKLAALLHASLYVQTSRWEVFGISVAEAMLLGVPCALAGTMNLAGLVAEKDLGLVLPARPADAAAAIVRALDDPQRLARWSSAAQAFAQHHFHPRTVAQNYLNVYGEALKRGGAA